MSSFLFSELRRPPFWLGLRCFACFLCPFSSFFFLLCRLLSLSHLDFPVVVSLSSLLSRRLPRTRTLPFVLFSPFRLQRTLFTLLSSCSHSPSTPFEPIDDHLGFSPLHGITHASQNQKHCTIFGALGLDNDDDADIIRTSDDLLSTSSPSSPPPPAQCPTSLSASRQSWSSSGSSSATPAAATGARLSCQTPSMSTASTSTRRPSPPARPPTHPPPPPAGNRAFRKRSPSRRRRHQTSCATACRCPPLAPCPRAPAAHKTGGHSTRPLTRDVKQSTTVSSSLVGVRHDCLET